MPRDTILPPAAKDFREFVYRTEPEWSLWGVEAPLAVVVAALAELSGGHIRSNTILTQPTTLHDADVSQITLIVDVKGSAWTVGYRTVGFYMPSEAELTENHAHADIQGLLDRLINGGDVSGSPSPAAPVPEPKSIVLLGLGGLAIAFCRHSR